MICQLVHCLRSLLRYRLLSFFTISEITTATYSRLLVDEYQDCNSEQHELACALSRLPPTVVFDDPMQCIFS
ncbi:UvrD-helicase domain-containing protein [Klebsiella pneumoniae]|uniref:UvrD-helicase domain-containing protein n=1 Tax=Klebsiella pneumoniae complex TaxID=3390273 RepID=UPI0034E878AD